VLTQGPLENRQTRAASAISSALVLTADVEQQSRSRPTPPEMSPRNYKRRQRYGQTQAHRQIFEELRRIGCATCGTAGTPGMVLNGYNAVYDSERGGRVSIHFYRCHSEPRQFRREKCQKSRLDPPHHLCSDKFLLEMPWTSDGLNFSMGEPQVHEQGRASIRQRQTHHLIYLGSGTSRVRSSIETARSGSRKHPVFCWPGSSWVEVTNVRPPKAEATPLEESGTCLL